MRTWRFAAVAGLLLACSVGLNTTDVQCLSEAECLAKGPAFANTTCDPVTKTCVPVDITAGECTTNQDCISANANAPAICRKTDHSCVLLETAECPFFHGTISQVADDNVVIVGELGLSNQTLVGTELEDVVAMAQLDFSQAVGGLPPVLGSTAVRPVVIQGCNELGNGVDGLLRAANHLVHDLQAPLIIGPFNVTDADIVLSQVTLPNKVPAILANIGPDFVDLPNPAAPTPMVWTISPGADVGGLTVAKFYNDDLCVPQAGNAQGCDPTSSRLVTMGIVPPGQPVKAMLIESGDVAGSITGGFIQKDVSFNCSFLSPGPCTAVDNAAPNPPSGWAWSWPEYSVANLGNPQDPVANPVPSATEATAIAAALAFQPNVIFWGSILPSQVVPDLTNLETQWDSVNPGVPHPIHVLNSLFGSVLSSLASSPLGVSVNLRKRLFFDGPLTPPPSSLTSDFSVRFKADYPQFTNALNSLHYQTNDAAYMAFYALAAVGPAPLTGQNIGLALASGKLNPPGTQVNTVPADLSKGLGTLAQGTNVDLNGLFSPLDFDVTTGAAHGDADIECYDTTYKLVSSGFKYSTETGTTSGTVNCP